MSQTYSLHQINSTLLSPFDPFRYSLFKFGDGHIADRFAEHLVHGFIDTNAEWIASCQDLVVVSYIYPFVSTASSVLAHHFYNRLNRYRQQRGQKPLTESKIVRTNTYDVDYGNLTRQDRCQLIDDEPFAINSDALRDKALIFVDDMKVTGIHQQMIERLLVHEQVGCKRIFVYYAEVTDSRIHPDIENKFNYTAVNSLTDLTAICESSDFVINARFIKYILNQDPIHCLNFFMTRSSEFLSTIYRLAIGSNYHRIQKFQPVIHLLQEMTTKCSAENLIIN